MHPSRDTTIPTTSATAPAALLHVERAADTLAALRDARVALIVGVPAPDALRNFLSALTPPGGVDASPAAREPEQSSLQLYIVSESSATLREALRIAYQWGLSDAALPFLGTLAELGATLTVDAEAVLATLPSSANDTNALLRALSLRRTRMTLFVESPQTAESRQVLQDWRGENNVAESGARPGGVQRLSLPGAPATRRLPPSLFAALRDALQAAALSDDGAGASIAELHEILERERFQPAAGRIDSGRGKWPYYAPQTAPLPPTLPSGRPWPRISIITPSFKQGEYIEQTLLSVANQRYPNVEHIVIDGGSQDATGEVLARWKDRLAYCVSEKDRGQSHAINKGFERATGELLMWLNSDDLLAPGALAAAALALDRTGADLVAGICEIHRDGELIERHLTCCDEGPLPLSDLLDIEQTWMAGQFFYQPEVIFTRDLWRRAGGRVDEAWFYSMDYELWLRFAEVGARLTVVGRPIAQFRVHAEQKTNLAEKFRAELDKVVAAFTARTGLRPAVRSRPGLGRDRVRIVFFNDIGYMAGAGLAHERLARACATAGHEIIALGVSEGSTLDRSSPATAAQIVAQIASAAPDCVVVGNLHSAALGPEVLGAIAGKWPTLFVMHDQWAITGRCAYTGGCEKFSTGCDHTCPTPSEYPALAPEQIAPAWRLKRMIYGAPNPPVLLANSAWMRDFADRGLAPPELGGAPRDHVQTIRLGVPTDVFCPRDAALCREHFDLPRDRFIIMTSGTSADDPRKGLAHLAQALDRLALPDVLVVSVGHADPSRPPPIPGMRAVGYLKSARELAMLYSAADLFVGPSLQEAFGQVFVEAAACGTPSVGYPVGGVPEAVLDGITGRIARAVTPAALAERIFELYSDPELRRRLSAWGRIAVENEFSLELAYQRFYTALVRSGVRERLDMRRKIWLAPRLADSPAVRSVDSTYPGWRAVSGFDHWEGPYPADNLPRCRWALGPISRFEFTADAVGPRMLLIECRNYWERQQTRIVVNGRVFGELPVPVTQNTGNHTLVVPIDVLAGINRVELHHWQWDATKPNRLIALLILGIQIVPVT